MGHWGLLTLFYPTLLTAKKSIRLTMVYISKARLLVSIHIPKTIKDLNLMVH